MDFKMKYIVFDHSTLIKTEFNSLPDAKQFVKHNHSDYVLCNDDDDNRFGYRCRYKWGGYPEGIEIYILEQNNERI